MIKLARNSKPSRIAAGFALATVVAILAAGCSSSSTGSTTTTSASTTTTAAANSTTTTTSAANSTTTTVANSTTTTTTSSGSSGSSLLSKFQSGEHATFIATYKITSGSSKSLTSLTIAEQPPDSLFGGTTTTGTFKLITLGTKSYICSGAAGSGAACFSEAAAGSLAGLFALYQPNYYLPYFQAAAKANGAQVSYSSKSVNGFSLSCVTVAGATNEKGTGTFCVTDQGVLGYVSWTGATAASAGSFEITSYSTTVPSGEFTLPATPTTIP